MRSAAAMAATALVLATVPASAADRDAGAPEGAPSLALLASVGSSKISVLSNPGTRASGGAVRRVGVVESGDYSILVSDRSRRESFHLSGPGVDRTTGVRYVGTTVWSQRLQAGAVYRYYSDGHRRLRGSFRAVALPLAPRVFARGLLAPRGLKFGPGGDLYVAEAGSGGSTSTAGTCEQTFPAFTSGTTARISRIDRRGTRSTIVDGLPSGRSALNLVLGVSDIAFVHGRLDALISGAGCSHGAALPNGVVRVRGGRLAGVLMNLSGYWKSHPTVNPDRVDPQPDGTPWQMVSVRNELYVTEPNHGELDAISASGKIRRVADFSATLGHVNTNALAYHRGSFYVATLGTFPVAPGTQGVYRLTTSGVLEPYRDGLTAVIALAFDRDGRGYALETSTAAGAPALGTGTVVRLDVGGPRIIVTGLSLPTAMTFGPGGDLYISNYGFEPPPSGAPTGLPSGGVPTGAPPSGTPPAFGLPLAGASASTTGEIVRVRVPD